MEELEQTVAVVGLGVLGLVAVKNLKEEGFQVTGFERDDYVGGLWRFTEKDQTSVLPSTIINISKERGCFTDFPFPEDTPSHGTAADVQKYLESYVEHFQLGPSLRLGTSVTQVRRDETRGQWELKVEGSDSLYFDKVIMATGSNCLPSIPEVEGQALFAGQALHSRAFKRPELFKGRKVLIVGLGNTGADTASALRGYAEKIYISHRHGSYVVPRVIKGQPFDHTLTSRIVAFQWFMERNFPSLAEKFFTFMVKKMQNGTFNIRPEWKLSPAPSLKHALPIVSDSLISMLESGEAESVVGLKAVVGPNEVELDDGSRLTVDTIIWCTGYKATFEMLDPAVDPTRHTTSEWAAAPGSRGKPLPRLYQNVFSLDYPKSLAFMGCVAFATGAFPLYDLASMAVAQVWKGNSSLPPQKEMERAVDRHHAWICGIAREGSVIPVWVKQHEWMAWAHEIAGTGVDEYLGWGWKGWKFWLTDHAFCKLLLNGLYSPHLFRVFDGKRKKWDGARAEIERVNRLVAARKKKSN